MAATGIEPNTWTQTQSQTQARQTDKQASKTHQASKTQQTHGKHTSKTASKQARKTASKKQDTLGFLVFNKGTAGDVIEAVLGWGWVRGHKDDVAIDPAYKEIHGFAKAELTEQEEKAVQDFRFVLEEAILGVEVFFKFMVRRGQTDEDVVRTLSSPF